MRPLEVAPVDCAAPTSVVVELWEVVLLWVADCVVVLCVLPFVVVPEDVELLVDELCAELDEEETVVLVERDWEDEVTRPAQEVRATATNEASRYFVYDMATEVFTS